MGPSHQVNLDLHRARFSGPKVLLYCPGESGLGGLSAARPPATPSEAGPALSLPYPTGSMVTDSAFTQSYNPWRAQITPALEYLPTSWQHPAAGVPVSPVGQNFLYSNTPALALFLIFSSRLGQLFRKSRGKCYNRTLWWREKAFGRVQFPARRR